jgi:hypothetical protein
MAREGQPSQLVLSLTDYDLVQHVTEDEAMGSSPQWRWWGTNGGVTGMNKGTVPRYGKLWLLPYDTGRSITSSYPAATTWFDELIVSKRRIPDPWVKTPNPPDDLEVANENNRNTVTWRDNSDVKGAVPATAFVVERCSGDIYAICYAGNSKFEPVAKLGKTTTWTDSPGSGNRALTYRVKAVNEAGDSAYSNAAMDTPGSVGDVTAQIIGPAAIEVTWDQSAPADATSYFVGRCAGTYQTCQLHDLNYRPVTCAEGSLDGNARKCTDRSFTAGAIYAYRVRSTNAAGAYKGWGGETFGPTTWSGGTKRAQIKAPQ